MRKSIRLFLSLFGIAALLTTACQFRPSLVTPVILIPTKPLGDGGIKLRELYRAYWQPPQSDDSSIYVGLIPSTTTLAFKTLEELHLRIYSEQESFEILSPKGVTWKVEYLAQTRPGIYNYLALVSSRLSEPSTAEKQLELNKWKNLGFTNAKWVGPPPMDQQIAKRGVEKWSIVLFQSDQKKPVELVCQKARLKISGSCQVHARTELPPLMRALISAENSNFRKEFVGYLEIVTRKKGVLVYGFSPVAGKNETVAEEYSDTIYILPRSNNSLTLVQQVSFANYLKAVVPSETFASGPAEAVKSQAVIARTYALRHEEPQEGLTPYHICASTLCQVYRGNRMRQDATDDAVDDTRDLVVWSAQNVPAQTYYHSICGGDTESARLAGFGKGEPYLDGTSDHIHAEENEPSVDILGRIIEPKESSYCGNASLTNAQRWAWEVTLKSDEIRQILEKLSLTGNLTAVEVLKRGKSGRALEILLRTTESSLKVSGEYKIRTIFGGLLSSLFIMDFVKNGDAIQEVLIRGKGYGHGVGLCQMGAIGRAEAGFNFRDILQVYYPGTSVSPILQNLK